MIEKVRHIPPLWELFTKHEEYTPSFLDQYKRFPYYLSKHRDVMEPYVSRYLIENGLEPKYPHQKKFAVCLTHDIDKVQYGLKSYVYNSALCTLKGEFTNAMSCLVYAFNKKKHPLWNFREIIELERKYGAKSSFYFLALKPNEKDYNYSLEQVAEEIKYISDNGWEVGLHGGHESYNNFEDILQKKKMLESVLGKEVVGYRNHYLRFKTPDTWELLSKAGFKYDTTFGYADCAGFRNGMCHPFEPFNLNTNKQIKIIEIPLVIMDSTLFKDYMKLDMEKAWEITRQLIDTVEECKGVITVLWHNTYMQEEYLKFYERLLKYCSDKNAWMTSGDKIYENMCCYV